MLFNLTLLIAVGLVSLVFVLPFIRVNESRPQYLLLCVILIVLYDASLGHSFALILPLGPINVFPMDIICPLLLAFAFPVIYGKIKAGFSARDWALVFLLVWTCTLVLNFMQGVVEFGIQPATNGFRAYLYTVSIALYLATRPSGQIWSFLERAAPWVALALILSAAVGYLDGDFSREGRPLSSGETMVLLQALIIMAFVFLEKRLSYFWFPVFLTAGPFVLLLQHRSVWMVGIIASAIIFCLIPRIRSWMVGFSVLVVILGSVAAFGFFGDKLFVAFKESTQEAVSDESTLLWRYLGWKSLLTGEQMDSLQEVALGNAFGTGWDRTIVGADGVPRFVEVMPHNYFIQTLLRSGVIGLLAFMCMYYHLIVSLFRSLRREDFGSLSPTAPLFIIITTQLVYFLPYGAEPLQAMFIGCAIAVVGQSTNFARRPVSTALETGDEPDRRGTSPTQGAISQS